VDCSLLVRVGKRQLLSTFWLFSYVEVGKRNSCQPDLNPSDISAGQKFASHSEYFVTRMDEVLQSAAASDCFEIMVLNFECYSGGCFPSFVN
jgi:hypothetical protein